MQNKKTAAILHGYGGGPASFWYPYLKNELEKKGYEVWLPLLPNTNNPNWEDQSNFILQNFKFTEDTVLIGHSIGSPLILAVLEKATIKIKQAVLVAGTINHFPELPKVSIKESFDWEKIKSNVQDIIFINSDNDPWGFDDKEGKLMYDKLGGTLIIMSGEAHMGSDKFNQPYKEFPFLLNLIKD